MIIATESTIKSGKLSVERVPASADRLDMADVAAVASALAGREIKRMKESDAEYRDRVIGNSRPAHQADLLLSIYAVGRCGEFGATDQAVGPKLRLRQGASRVLRR